MVIWLRLSCAQKTSLQSLEVEQTSVKRTIIVVQTLQQKLSNRLLRQWKVSKMEPWDVW